MIERQVDGTQGTILCVDVKVIICYIVTGDIYAKNSQAKSNSGIDQSRPLRLNN